MYSRFNPFYRNNAEPGNGPQRSELPYTTGLPGHSMADQMQPRSYETAPMMNNNNLGSGVLNNVSGTQNNDNRTEINEGDHFNGPMSGGNFGGRGNTNTVHNNAGPSSRTAPPLFHATTAPGNLPRRGPPLSPSNYEIYGMEMELQRIEQAITQAMAGWDQRSVLQKKIEAARRLLEEVQGQ
ncbi:hypothetical protein ONZ45_g11715 [Pleurotus djamor]|nr:hypothetical protein ONZ45_g11715 [Pleurotus djamor]